MLVLAGGGTDQRKCLGDAMSLPKPYYEDEKAGITIYHGDCREIMPLLPKADLVLTDPPYGIGYVNCAVNIPNATRFSGVKVIGDDAPFDPSFLLEFSDVILWGANHFKRHLPDGGRWLVWDKRCGVVPMRDTSDIEIAWISGPRKADRIFRHVWDGFLKDSEMGTQRTHPTQKPVPLMAWCLSFFPNAQNIRDPFMGSGTTLRAAKDLGRKCIGIEIEEKYCEIAARRLAQEVLPL